MVLAAIVGWSLQQFAAVEGAFVLALLIGMFAAMWVPAKGACTVPPRPDPTNGPRDP